MPSKKITDDSSHYSPRPHYAPGSSNVKVTLNTPYLNIDFEI